MLNITKCKKTITFIECDKIQQIFHFTEKKGRT